MVISALRIACEKKQSFSISHHHKFVSLKMTPDRSVKMILFFLHSYPASKYMPKVNNKNTAKYSEIYLKLIIKTRDRRH